MCTITRKNGFTLVEMLVVIGIISILAGLAMGSFSKIVARAEKAKCQELVSNAATALTRLFQEDGVWPKVLLASGKVDGKLDERAAFPLAKRGYLSLTMNSNSSALDGYDKFGVITPWAVDAVKRAGVSASLSTTVSGGGKVSDHILHYAIDFDGDGVISGASVGGEPVDVRADVIVWSGGKDGVIEPYTKGKKKDDVYSWTEGQTRMVQ